MWVFAGTLTGLLLLKEWLARTGVKVASGGCFSWAGLNLNDCGCGYRCCVYIRHVGTEVRLAGVCLVMFSDDVNLTGSGRNLSRILVK